MRCLSLARVLSAVALTIALAACGGGGGDGGGTSSTPSGSSGASIGVFVDSPVINIGYRTATRSGVTNALGEYEFLPGETVTFFIGNLEFPPVPASGVVTPLDIAGTANVSDPSVVNMIRLLQTLDKDGDPTNGIEITDAAKAAATQVDFSLSVASFESDPAVVALITNGGQDTPVSVLVDETLAIDHFQSVVDNLAVFPIDLSTTTASSTITYSECPGVPGGWNYTFTNTTLTLTGSDSWNDPPGCALGAAEVIGLTVAALGPDFDVPFNCAAYPVCDYQDFNKTFSGVDGDGRAFTSTYTFDSATGRLTYVKSVAGESFTEVITLDGVGGGGDVTQFDETMVVTLSLTNQTTGPVFEAPDGLGGIISISCEHSDLSGLVSFDLALDGTTGIATLSAVGVSETGTFNDETDHFTVTQVLPPVQIDDNGEVQRFASDGHDFSGTVDPVNKTMSGTWVISSEQSWSIDERTSSCSSTYSMEGVVQSSGGA